MARLKKAKLPYGETKKASKLKDDSAYYGSMIHKNARALHLYHYPFCEESLSEGITEAGNILDHIIPISQGGSKTDPRNFQTMTEERHNKKRQKESSGYCEAWVLNKRGEKIPKRNKDKKMKY